MWIHVPIDTHKHTHTCLYAPHSLLHCCHTLLFVLVVLSLLGCLPTHMADIFLKKTYKVALYVIVHRYAQYTFCLCVEVLRQEHTNVLKHFQHYGGEGNLWFHTFRFSILSQDYFIYSLLYGRTDSQSTSNDKWKSELCRSPIEVKLMSRPPDCDILKRLAGLSFFFFSF